MEIEMVKDPFDYRRFWVVIPIEKGISMDDANLFGSRIASQLTRETKTKWSVETCVGNKCTLKTKVIHKREKRKKLKGQVIEVNGGILE